MSKDVSITALEVVFSDRALLAIGHSLGRVSPVSQEMALAWAEDQLERAVEHLHPELDDDGTVGHGK